MVTHILYEVLDPEFILPKLTKQIFMKNCLSHVASHMLHEEIKLLLHKWGQMFIYNKGQRCFYPEMFGQFHFWFKQGIVLNINEFVLHFNFVNWLNFANFPLHIFNPLWKYLLQIQAIFHIRILYQGMKQDAK